MSHVSTTGLLLAVDQGTTNTKALLIDREGKPIFRTSRPLSLATPQAGFVEQDPMALWESVRSAVTEAAEHARSLGMNVEGIAISNQRETALAWDRETGKPLAPAMSWQCRRSTEVCRNVSADADRIRRITGLPLDPVLSATKWVWTLQHLPVVQQAAERGTLCFGTMDSWLLWQLSCGEVHATDLTNASRTGLLDLNTLQWSSELLSLLKLPVEALPELRPSAALLATCCAVPELKGIPVLAAIGDSHAALAGHGDFTRGAIKATYGTGSSLMLLIDELPEDTAQLSRTVAWSIEGKTQFALEGNIFMTGSAVQWVGEFLGLPHPTTDALALAESAPDAAGLYFVPAMVGLGAPYWNAEARGLLCGLERSHTAVHMARAAVDAIAYQIADVFFAMQGACGNPLTVLHTDGGATRNNALMQLQADVLGVPVHRAGHEELSAIGAAYLAGMMLGWWPSFDALQKLSRESGSFTPQITEEQQAKVYSGWKNAVARALQNSKEAA